MALPAAIPIIAAIASAIGGGAAAAQSGYSVYSQIKRARRDRDSYAWRERYGRSRNDYGYRDYDTPRGSYSRRRRY